MTDEPPAFRVAPVVVFWIGALVLGHLVFLFAPERLQAVAQWSMAVYPVRYDPVSNYSYSGFIPAIAPLLGHGFLHAGLLHLGLNSLFLLQAGAPLARRLGEGWRGLLRFSLIFLGSIAAGGATYILFNPGSDIPAVGASGGVCGVFAAFFLSMRGDWRESLSDRFARNGLLVFLVLNVGLASLGRMVGIPIAWEAHLGGFVAGCLLQPLLASRTPSPARSVKNR